MNIKLARLVVETVVIHDIPARPTRAAMKKDPNQDTHPTLSERPSDLDAGLRRYFEERLVGSLYEAGYPVNFDPNTDSSVPGLVPDYLSPNPSDLVEISRVMALALHDRQTNITPAGLFAVVSGMTGGVPYIALMKLEREQGLVIEPVDERGQLTFRIVIEDDLVLTERTKVFKTGLFQRLHPDTADDIIGLVSDHQTGFRQTRAVAEFFLKFLGCRLLIQPELQTRDYFVETERWLNQAIKDPVRRARYEQALITEMNSNKPRVSPRRWAEENLEVEDRKSFEESMSAKSIPMTSFSKDTKLIENYLRQVQMSTENGAQVYAPLTMLEEGKIQVATAPEDEQSITIRERIRRVRGG